MKYTYFMYGNTVKHFENIGEDEVFDVAKEFVEFEPYLNYKSIGIESEHSASDVIVQQGEELKIVDDYKKCGFESIDLEIFQHLVAHIWWLNENKKREVK